MPPLRKGVTETNAPLETETNGGPKTVAEGNRGKIETTEKRKILENNPEAKATDDRKETKKREGKDAITKKPSVNQPRIRNIEMAKKIVVPRKDLATETERSGESEQTKPILEKTDAPITGKRRRYPKRRALVVFSQNFSANRLPLVMPKQRVHAQSGSL